MTFSPVRLNHAVLFFADLDRSRFYTDLLGMETVTREPRAKAAGANQMPSTVNVARRVA